ncbi:hypothetical protein HHI36_008520 [Cryptolaemus montrouzieri]|uniref:Ionotropic receptor 75a N-terminal domain-containing protein n=1 Tax=Cryptolaemus montrouzieri TaxID=559131 RepID=A0ABD2MT74_9CUCU
MSRMCSKEGIKWRLSKNESQFLDTPLDATVQFNIMNTDFDSTETILTQASKQGFLKKPYKWIIFETLTEIEKHDFYLGIDSEFLVFEEYSDGYSITAIHKINERMETFIRTEIGTWNQKNGITNYKALSFYANRKDLNGSDFPLSFWASNPITYDTVGDYRYETVVFLLLVNTIILLALSVHNTLTYYLLLMY